MLLIVGTDFSKMGVYSKSVIKFLCGKFLVSETIFKLNCSREKGWWSDISGTQGILVKNILTNCWIVTVAYLKKQPPEAFYEKGSTVLEVFLIKLLARAPAPSLKRDSSASVFLMKFPKLFRKKYLWTSAFVSSQVILLKRHEKDIANEA